MKPLTVTVVHRLKWAGTLLAIGLFVFAVGYPWFQMGYYKAHMDAQYVMLDASAKKHGALVLRYKSCVEQLTRVYNIRKAEGE